MPPLSALPGRHLYALCLAAVTASAGTGLLWFILAGLPQAPSAVPASLGLVWLMLPLLVAFSVMLGFFGAALFLGVAFVMAARRGAGRRGYVLAGAAAGLVHALAGVVATLAGINDFATGSSLWWLGFVLIDSSWDRDLVVAFSAAVSGALAGLVFAAVAIRPGTAAFVSR